MRTPVARSLVGFVAASLVAAACGGDDTATTTTTAAPTTTTTTTAPTTTTAAPTTTTTTTTTTPPVTLARSEVFVTTVGMGRIRVGMTVDEAATAAGFALEGEPDPDVSTTCYHVRPPDDESAYAGVSFMVENDRIVRIEVSDGSPVTTRSGAGIGISQSSLEAMFPGQIEAAPDFVVDGTAVQFVPADDADAQYRVVFVLEDGVVSQFRAGVLPAVGYGEGCV